MRAFTSIDIIKLLLFFSLFLVLGCAQNAYTLKEGQPANGDTAVLRDISVTGDEKSARVEIQADKPLTYTYYSLKEPFRTVIDLSQTDPGTVQSLIQGGATVIKTINVEKNELTSGSLVRLTIETKEEIEFASASDSTDSNKLIFALVIPQKPAASLEPDTTVSNVSDRKIQEGSDKISRIEVLSDSTEADKGEEPVNETHASTTLNDQVQQQDASLPTSGNTIPPNDQNTPLTVTGLEVVDDGIIINAGGKVDNFRYFTLSKPQRLAIDIFNVKNGIPSKTVKLNCRGIASARLGTYPDKVRIVFDSAKTKFPAFQIEKIGSGIKLVLSEQSATTAREMSMGKSFTGKKEPSAVEAIDFKIVNGYSRISVTTTGDCILNGPAKTTDGLVMTFPKCTLPKSLQRPFDTSAFASVVKKFTPYQTRVKGTKQAKILITLREASPYTVKRDGNVINLDIKNNEPPASPKLVSGREEHPIAASSKLSPEVIHKRSPTTAKSQTVAIERKFDKKAYTGKRVTLEFADADIRKIFQLIAEVSNMNILVGDDVTGTISIKLVNVPWDQALDVIMETKGLGMKRKDNIIVIRPKSKITTLADEELAAQKAYERTLELRTRIFDVNYASVSDIAGQFNNFKSERGTISTDDRTNRVIVNDISPRIEKMAELLKNLDIPEKQVLIEARIVEATSTFAQDLGIQWGIHYRDGSASMLGINSLDTGFGGLITNLAPSSGFPAAGTAGGAMGLSFGKLTSNVQLDLRLSAAAENGEVKIISTPKVVTLNNKSAKISQGQMIPYATVSAEGTKTEFIEAALTLEVTPHITADGGVSMKIKATNNSAGSAATGVAPPINKKEATTELLVQNGETTVIGGIYVDSDTTTDTGVPYLKDIPLLGWLFKSQNLQKTKTELLIFITPKIVS